MTAPSSSGWVTPPEYAARIAAAGGSTTVPMARTLADALCALGVALDQGDPWVLRTAGGALLDPQTAYRLIAEQGLLDQLGASLITAADMAAALELAWKRRADERAHGQESRDPSSTVAVAMEPEQSESDQWPPRSGSFVARARERWRRE